MAYVKNEESIEKYQGTSFTKTLTKSSGEIWEDNEILEYIVTDNSGTEVANGNLVKSDDKLQITFLLGSSDTDSFIGDFLLLVHLKDSIELEIDNIIAEYHLTYINKKAT